MRSLSDDLLLEIKTRGPRQAQDLAARAGVSRQAVRQALEKLAAEGLVAHSTAPAGVGRPRQTWSLTEKGHSRFPDTHAQMTVELIEAVQAEFGVEGLDRLVARREHTIAEGYRVAVGDVGLEDRLDRLTALREAEGYMAAWSQQEDGSYLLVENHCPICAAARVCQGFCRSELALFEMLLAPARVARIEHILAGARRCAYRVTVG